MSDNHRLPPAEWFRRHAEAARRQIGKRPWDVDRLNRLAREWDEYADRVERTGSTERDIGGRGKKHRGHNAMPEKARRRMEQRLRRDDRAE
jgi:hypothetical protein